MTFKQLLLRYLKEQGLFHYLSIRGYSRLLRNNSSSNVIETLRLVDYILHLSGVRWFYSGDKMYLFLKDWAGNDFSVEKGDIVTVKTTDGKYSFDYQVFSVWLWNYTFTTHNGNCISLDRIIAVNGKLVDLEKGWYFKRNLNYIH